MRKYLVFGLALWISGCSVAMSARKCRPGLATAHAVADVLTLGLWEAIGTPAGIVTKDKCAERHKDQGRESNGRSS